MSTLILDESDVAGQVDDFSALEQRILRAIEVVKTEKAARQHADENLARVQGMMDAQAALLTQAQDQVRTLERDRDQVRQRVERLLKQLDEITS